MRHGRQGWLAGLGLVLALLPGAAHAQGRDAFADVPPAHWASEAVTLMANCGMFIGYPDGSFGGRRALTRYEGALGLQRLRAETLRQLNTESVPIPGPRGAMGPRGPQGPQGPPAAPQAEWTRILSETQALRQDVNGLRDAFAGLREQLRTLRGEVSDLSEQTQPLSNRVEHLHRNRHRVLLERGR